MIKLRIVLLVLTLASCSSSLPEGILPPEKMTKIVGEMIQVDEYINNFLQRDTAVKKKRSIYYEQVFRLNKVSRQDFYKTITYYEQHPDIQKTMFDSLYKITDERPIEPPHPMPLKQ